MPTKFGTTEISRPSDDAGVSALSRTPNALKVFISYSRKDLAFAEDLLAGLELLDFTPTLDRHSIAGGEDWRARLRGLIAGTDTVVFVISPDSIGSDVCGWEIEEALRLGKRLVPVVLHPVQDDAHVPESLRALNYIFFHNQSFLANSGSWLMH